MSKSIRVLLALTVLMIFSACQSRYDELEIQADEIRKLQKENTERFAKAGSDYRVGLITGTYYSHIMDEFSKSSEDLHFKSMLIHYEKMKDLGTYTNKEYEEIVSLLRSERLLKSELRLIKAKIDLRKTKSGIVIELESEIDSINKKISDIDIKIMNI